MTILDPTSYGPSRRTLIGGPNVWLHVLGIPVSALVIVGVWAGAKSAGLVAPVVPGPGETWSAARELADRGYLGLMPAGAVGTTAWRLLASWLGGMVFGGLIGSTLGVSETLRGLLDPLITMLRFAIPVGLVLAFAGRAVEGDPAIVATAALLPVWIGADTTARIASRRRHGIAVDSIETLTSMSRVALLAAVLVLGLVETDLGLGAYMFNATAQQRYDIVAVALILQVSLAATFDYSMRLIGFLSTR